LLSSVSLYTPLRGKSRYRERDTLYSGQKCTMEAGIGRKFVTGNEIPRIVTHRCIIEASISKRIVQTIEVPHSPSHWKQHWDHSPHRSIVHIHGKSQPPAPAFKAPNKEACRNHRATCVTGRHAVRQPQGLNSHHRQIATKYKDAAQYKGKEHWRAGANRATVRPILKA
jgi:hypothetical protein